MDNAFEGDEDRGRHRAIMSIPIEGNPVFATFLGLSNERINAIVRLVGMMDVQNLNFSMIGYFPANPNRMYGMVDNRFFWFTYPEIPREERRELFEEDTNVIAADFVEVIDPIKVFEGSGINGNSQDLLFAIIHAQSRKLEMNRDRERQEALRRVYLDVPRRDLSQSYPKFEAHGLTITSRATLRKFLKENGASWDKHNGWFTYDRNSIVVKIFRPDLP